ncbi:HAMP domain-containing protein [Anaeromyxobacter dehalogenans]|uniref:histidine kinase n=1 Tax=Anaeromyxobacter dehalogenans (strain 2CP-C) TaxID=290397 RepID=Q2IH28_ANADE|nr:HAMP domain-containing protein [Anaeromyxobacter dehalogenans]ABC83886.1 GAF sensor hybrid histidine kinase [Anaeromyxobacter dehalogenans 2CP-C]
MTSRARAKPHVGAPPPPAAPAPRAARPAAGARSPGGPRRGNGAEVVDGRTSTPPPAAHARLEALDPEDREELAQLVEVLKAAKAGDFSVRLPYRRDGLLSQAGELLNDLIALNEHAADELVRVGRVVGQEGRSTERASVGPARGAWAASVGAVNQLISDLVAPTNEVARVLTAVATGDLSQKVALDLGGRPVRGEFLRIATSVNALVDQLSAVSAEVRRVVREVGSEGKLGGQASLKGLTGTWKDLTDDVNGLSANLTAQLRNIAKVTTAVAKGDLSQKITVDARGEILELRDTINTMVDQLSSFAAEVTRVAKEVGNEGKLGGQADVRGVSGTWKDLTDNVNGLAANLTAQVRNIAKVTTAVANGDLSQKITVDAKGEINELKNTINTMVDTLRSFAAEVTRVAKEVGTEGKLGGQADVKGVAGTWKDLTDNVNGLAANLTVQLRDVSKVATAIAHGDLTQKITVDVRGEILQIKDVINRMVDQLNSFAAEVTRVAKEVGTEGKLGGQANVRGVSGTWKDLTDNVNAMASNLTVQLRDVSKVSTAIANGDLTQKITVDVKGEIAQIKDATNKMVDQLNSFAAEVTRVAREVGTEGKLGGQANVRGVSGTWKDLTDNVNGLAANLTNQVRNIALVTTAVANGDLSQKITVEARGEIYELKNTINVMVDQLRSFAAEVTRVAKEVGTEGKLGGQAYVKGVSGTWKDLTENVNGLAANLTNQVRNIALVTTAVANGDLSQKITVEARGEIYELKNTINVMVDQLRSFAAEVTRVAKEVGTEGKLGGQAYVKGVSGTWKDLTENVNGLAANLTNQVRNIAKVTTAVAHGDLTQKITVEARGEILELKNTINVMVDQLNSFAAEVTRVAKEVGTDGKLGGQAEVKGVSGTWKDLTDNVNALAANLTNQVRNIALVTTAVANGDLSQKITVDAKGEILELKDTINVMVDQLNSFAAEVTRVAKEVGTDGKLGGQADVRGVSGVWKDLTDSVNLMATNLTTQVRGIIRVVTAIANGDLSQKFVLEAKGEVAALAETINGMTDTLRTFGDQVSSVAREVGIEGKLGAQAHVPGASGIWKDLTDNVNFMAANLTKQVRGIVKVVTAIANGDLSQKFILEAKGEVAALAETINGLTGTLGIFADEVSSVAREVGIEGKLGGQAKVPGVSGIWKNLTDNVNQLAGSLSAQVRAIAEVSTAVTKGDLTRKVAVQAQGEVAALKDNINQMIEALRDTTDKNTAQDWLKTNLANFSNMMQGQRNIVSVAQAIISELTPLVDAQHGAFFMLEQPEDGVPDEPVLRLIGSYGFGGRRSLSSTYHMKETLIGQCAFEKKRIIVSDVPEGFLYIASGMGEAPPRNLLVLPVLFEGEIKAVIELASFREFSPNHLAFLDQLMEKVGFVLNMISSNMRMEGLLLELKRSNAELEAQAAELNEKARLLEQKNSEVELASRSLEEKAEQLQLISRYKSEFLANMSHELRTPLNSLLILSKMLAENRDGNLTVEQVKFASTVYTSGHELLGLINEILDLSKIEAGKMPIEPRDTRLESVRDDLEQTFRHVAEHKGLGFQVRMAPDLPDRIHTDPTRLQQILKNLISNAFKFTERGEVVLEVSPAAGGALAFAVRDTGIGIPADKQKLIFEAFQQADGTTSRKYGGTGLGLTISREIARLLGGSIEVESAPGRGSVFTLVLPARWAGAETGRDPAMALAAERPEDYPELPTGVDFSGRTVLLADDDMRNLFAIHSVLETAHVKVIHAQNGREALQVLEASPQVDLVLMDTMMPEMDGLTAIRAIRAQARYRSLPIVSLTAKAMKGDRDDALAAGATDYVAKPVDPQRLLSVIGRWLAEPDARMGSAANGAANGAVR